MSARMRMNMNYQNQPRHTDHMQQIRDSLPVFKYKQIILEAINKNSIILIVGETGSGKTTQIPQYLLDWDQVSSSNKIVCTQPRTVAATSVAERVSFERTRMSNQIGKEVGFHIRLDKTVNDDVTKLVYMTEGVLVRKAMNDNLLRGYKVVIIDEAHERTVNADLLMGFLKRMVIDRDDLRVVIMSATLDTERFKKYFNNPPVIQIPGSLHPIQHYWLQQPTMDYLKLVQEIITAIHNDPNAFHNANDGNKYPDGHILVFLTGQQEIDSVVRKFKDNRRGRQYQPQQPNQYGFTLEVHPLYASLSANERKRAFDEPKSRKTRKVVVATNIAETSLTIENVVYVIDCGLSKQKVYSPSKGVEALGVRGISKASVKQRIGRAGRVKPGKAYHLYTQMGYEQFPNETRAEILRSGLVSETLSMLALGLQNPLKFDFIDAPDEMTMARAMNTLYHLNAIDDHGHITHHGELMAKFPVSPQTAACLLYCDEYNCSYEMIVIASMLEIVEKLWRRPRDDDKQNCKNRKKSFYHIAGDHLTLLNIYNAFKKIKTNHSGELYAFCQNNFLDRFALNRADQIRTQLERTLTRIKLDEHRQNNNQYDDNNNNNISNDGKYIFKLNDHRYKGYYDNIIQCLLRGYFMNVAVQGFGGKYWTFRVLTLCEKDGDKAIDIVDKASAHPTSMFYKNSSRNWIIFHEIQISHTTQLRVLTAIKPAWLVKVAPTYYDIYALKRDKSPIVEVLRACANEQ